MMPFDFATYRRMFGLAFADRMTPRRRRLIFSLLFAIPVFAAVNAVCWVLDRVLFPGIRHVEVRRPVFVIGHARSGTTLMHKLMTADERMSYFMTYEMLVPSVLQKKIIRFVGRLDRERFDGAIERRIKAWEDKTFAKGRQMHPMSLTGPEEDEFVLALSCASGVWVTVFPYLRELDYLYYFDDASPAWRRRILAFYRECVRRHLYLNGPEKIHCSKNPTFSGKVESLIEAFPDARFVVLMRNPLETIPSLLKMMERNWRASDCDRARMDDSLDCLAEQSFHTYTYPLEVLERHPDTPFAVVDYRELVADPKRVVADVYAALDIEMTEQLAAALDAEQARSREHRAEHVYDLDEFGLEKAGIRDGLSELFEHFGWEKEVGTEGSRESDA